MMSKLCAAALLFVSAYAQSISSCGGASDHMQNVAVKVSPDPPVKGKPISLTLSGTLDGDWGAGIAEVDLNVKALGIIKQQIKSSTPFSVTPLFKQGPQSVSIGPFSLPKLPGTFVVKGTVKLVNEKSEPVACVNVDLDVPALEVAPSEPTDALQGLSCGKPTDHLKNIAASSSGGVLTVTGKLDETITKGIVHAALKVHAFFSIPIKVDVPFALSPGLASGDFKLTAGPTKPGALEALPVSVTGTVTIDDGSNEEICCVNVGSSDEVRLAANASHTRSTTHYGDPKKGCQSGEQAVKVRGIAGDFCSPQCKSGVCPTDVPSGVTAKPQCALKTTAGKQYCALICEPSELRTDGANGECGAGACQPLQGTGMCTYASAGLNTLVLAPAATSEVVV